MVKVESFWKPVKFKQSRKGYFLTTKVKLNHPLKPKQIDILRNTRINISKRNLTYQQAIRRYPKLTAFGDADRDGKLNMFDCKPFDRNRHGKSKLLQEEIARRVFKAELKDIEKEDTYEEGGEKFKSFSKRAIIKHAAKHPRLIKELEKVNEIYGVEKPINKEGLVAGAMVYADPKRTKEGLIKRDKRGEVIYGKKQHGIEFAKKLYLKEDIGEDLEHELGHIQQYRNREKGKKEGKEFLKQTQEEIEENKDYYEKVEKKKEAGEKLSHEEYDELKNELDAENRRKRLKAIEESWSDEKPKAIVDLEKINEEKTDSNSKANI